MIVQKFNTGRTKITRAKYGQNWQIKNLNAKKLQSATKIVLNSREEVYLKQAG